jgi:hypothetical protein
MPKRRRLGDLYVTGQKVPVNDDSDFDPIEVWIQKLNPLEQENALRRGSAERAKWLALSKNRESDAWLAQWSDIHEFTESRDDLLHMALREEIAKIRAKAEAEVTAEERWSKDNHLQEVFDAWHGTTDTITDGAPTAEDDEPTERDSDGETEPLRISILRGEEDHRYAAAVAIEAEIKAWGEQVEETVKAEKERLFADHASLDEDALLDLATEKMIEQKANTMMLDEFQTQELFYAVRDVDDHSKKYFGTRDEVASLQPPIREKILNVYRGLYVDQQEGKGLPGMPGSSAQSDSSAVEATPNSSGPEA